MQGKLCSLAIYLRTSLEDYGKSHRLIDESCSIDNQRHLIQEYLTQQSDLRSLSSIEYADDGFTGTNTDRPHFQAMLRDIHDGRIGAIVVKDLSRLGRSYLEVGDYLERVFPAAGIRVIAINDGYDSNNYIGATGGLDVAFRNFIYDSYSKDLSVKVRSAMLVRMEKGKFVNHAPYGYLKSPTDKHLLVPDPQTAPVVREIFAAILGGLTTTQVAMMLNDRHIPTPLEYKQHKIKPSCQNRELFWSHITIIRIIQNLKYTGAMVNHTRESQFLRDPNQRRTSPDEWIITESAHEPLVTREEFDRANAMLRHPKHYSRQASSADDNVFYCGHCGHKLEKTYGHDTYFSCPTRRYQSNAACGNSRFSKSELEGILLPVFRVQLDLLEQRVIQARKQTPNPISYVRQMYQLEKEMEKCNQEKLRLFEAYHDGTIDLDEFIARKEKLTLRRDQLQHDHAALEADHQVQTDHWRQRQKTEDRASAYLSAVGLADEHVIKQMYEAIDRVYIYSSKEVDVRWKFQDLFADVLSKQDTA